MFDESIQSPVSWRPLVAGRRDLLTDARYLWRGERNYVELNPLLQPAHIFRVRRWLTGEKFV